MADPGIVSGPIQHVIVVMLENRSYDNILGMLYAAGETPPPFVGPTQPVAGLVGQSALNGLTAGGFSNPAPNHQPAIAVTETTDTTCPAVDPGEPFEAMAQQFLGLEKPLAFNPTVPTPSSGDPYAAAPLQPMGGFVTNYALQPGVTVANLGDVMTYFTPASLPVTAFLAQNFMVCDQWFASVPTHTFVNRIFSLAAQAGTFVNRDGATYSYVNDIEFTPKAHDNPHIIWGAYPQPIMEGCLVNIPTVFRQLDAVCGTGGAVPNWKVYFHDYSIAQNLLTDVGSVVTETVANSTADVLNVGPYDESYYGLTGPVGEGPWPPWASHHWFRDPHYKVSVTVTSFKDDLTKGTLPGFCLIEPQYSCNYNPWWPIKAATVTSLPNSNHPGQSGYPLVHGGAGPPTDCANGEAFLADLVSSVYQSEYWEKSVIIITYDEPGGMYDHVFPPAAVPPSSDVAPTYTGAFTFERLGGRVPAIIVSPYAYKASAMQAAAWTNGATSMPAGATAFDHTSIIKTVWDLFGIATGPNGTDQLTDRDGAAPSILPYLASTAVNDTKIPGSTNPADWSSP